MLAAGQHRSSDILCLSEYWFEFVRIVDASLFSIIRSHSRGWFWFFRWI